jgi:hypothetical protein
MSTRGARRAALRGRPAALAGLALLAVLALGACGSKDFPNDPRAPAPKEISAKVDSRQVVVSPDKIGAGLAVFTVANLSESPVRFTVSGPKTEASTAEIEPGSPANLKVNLREGDYRVSAGRGVNIRPDTIAVGPERKSSQNRLLLP